MNNNRTTLNYFVFTHGLHGEKNDWDAIIEVMTKQLNNRDNVKILVAESNEKRTTEGIMRGGQNVAEEILGDLKTIDIKNKDIHFSMIGHSLGGLFSRCAVKYLFEDKWFKKRVNDNGTTNPNNKEEDTRIIPTSFITIATPNLGSKRAKSDHWGKSFYKWGSDIALGNFIQQTGKDLGLINNVLEDLSTKDEFIKPLMLFKYPTLISSIYHDMTVPFCTASARHDNPYDVTSIPKDLFIAGFSNHFNKNLSGWFRSLPYFSEETAESFSYTVPEKYAKQKDGFSSDTFDNVLFQNNALVGINQVPWRRLDIQFPIHTQMQKLSVHTAIIQKVHPVTGYLEKAIIEHGKNLIKDVFVPLLLLDHNIYITEQ
mmetsp:Transcript_3130/g.4620  ORF Transcript_3130/g.4620 Transcript_3130/m.4620 type:complete len:371 (+) Transcript_3130:39-1151(+)